MASLTGEPIYDLGLAGAIAWLIKQGVIVVRTRGDKAGEDGSCSQSVSDALREICTALKLLADQHVGHTEILKRTDERLASRSGTCAFADERPPRHIDKLNDLPESVGTLKQTVDNLREITLGLHSRLSEMKSTVDAISIRTKVP